MGSLYRFDIGRYRETYNLDVLFETGTLYGEGVSLALDAGFEKVYSVEIMDQFFQENVERFKDRRGVTILHGESTAVLDATLDQIPGNILFWLDAHFPGADGHLAQYNDCEDESVRCPMEKELRTIHRHRPGRRDMFILDDLWLYEVGEFGAGNCPSFIDRPANTDLSFIDELFGDTHYPVKLYYDQGYILLLPDDHPPKLYVQQTTEEVPVAIAGPSETKPTARGLH